MHPNLYAIPNGKVCLSILGTWGTMEWSPLLTLEKILMTIQGLMDDNPLAHEPSFEKTLKTSPEVVNYCHVARYRVLRAAIYGMRKRTDIPTKFQEIIKEYYPKYVDKYLSSINKLDCVDGKTVDCLHGSETISTSSLLGWIMDTTL